jgi:hypothetical protein
MHYRIHQPLLVARQRHPKRFIICLLILLAIVCIGGKVLTAPVQGHRIALDQKVVRSNSSIIKAPAASNLDNQYFLLHLPLGYRLSSSRIDTGDSLLTDVILKPSITGTSIHNVAVLQLPSGGLESVSNFRVRSTAPGTYKLSSMKLSGDIITLSTRIDGEAGEVVAFWPHGTLLATIAVSTGEAASNGDTEANTTSLQTLLNAWRWH